MLPRSDCNSLDIDPPPPSQTSPRLERIVGRHLRPGEGLEILGNLLPRKE